MAELTNTFTQGKMNKDLDERLVPNGQYRDALNLEVSSSEGSNIGSLQTILGNFQIGGSSQSNIPADAVCIGVSENKETSKIYALITSSTVDLIAEIYDTGGGIMGWDLVLVDTGAVLNFSSTNLVTGINVLDGVIYFTDNLTEPKRVDIEYWKSRTPNLAASSTGLTEENITVIRKSPLNAPYYRFLESSTRSGIGTKGGDLATTSAFDFSAKEPGDSYSGLVIARKSPEQLGEAGQAFSRDIDTFPAGSIISYTYTDPGLGVPSSVRTIGLDNTTSIFSPVGFREDYSDIFALGPNGGQVYSVVTMSGVVASANSNTVYSISMYREGNKIEEHEITGGFADLSFGSFGKYSYQDFSFKISADENIDFTSITLKAEIKETNTTTPSSPYTLATGTVASSAFSIITSVNTGLDIPNYKVDDIILLRKKFEDVAGIAKESLIKVSIDSLDSQLSSFSGKVLTKVGPQQSGEALYDAILEENEPLFRLKFPRFSYRYKYSNGQYSCFAPFSVPAFLPGDFRFTSKDSYNRGMENNVRKVELEGWLDDLPNLVSEVDILYTESNSNSVYVVDTISPQTTPITKATTLSVNALGNGYVFGDYDAYIDSASYPGREGLKIRLSTSQSGQIISASVLEGGTGFQVGDVVSIISNAGTQGSLTVSAIETISTFLPSYEIKNEQIFKAVNSNQLVRPFDNVPRKAKSQEIIGNRLVYGNYTQGINYNKNVSFDTSIVARQDLKEIEQKLSLKSDRSYQLGVVFQDKYGRQTPVVTNKTGVIEKSFIESEAASALKVSTTATPPVDSTRYSYYVKETSEPYYNLCASNFYEDEEGYMHISFPSSEVNKLTKDDYLILKKSNGSNSPAATHDKLKVLDISSEPPTFLAVKEEVVYKAAKVKFNRDFHVDIEITSKRGGSTPVVGFNTVQLRQAETADGSATDVSAASMAAFVPGAKVKFSVKGTDIETEIYEIETVASRTHSGEKLEVVFTSAFGEDIESLYKKSSIEQFGETVDRFDLHDLSISVLNTTFDTANEKYQNKFFVKVDKTTNLLNSLIEGTGAKDFEVAGSGSATTWGNPNTAAKRLYQAKYDVSERTVTIKTWASYTDADSSFANDPFTANLVTGNYLRLEPYVYFKPGSLITDGKLYGPFTSTMLIEEVSSSINSSNQKEWVLKISEGSSMDLGNWNGTTLVGGGVQYSDIRFSALSFNSDNLYELTNPPVFETEAKKQTIDIYYQTENTYPIAELATPKVLSYANCFSFGNGVESDRIRDDFNAVTLGKGVVASTVLKDDSGEEEVKTGLIFSQIYNSLSGVNDLNQFIAAEGITKNLNPINGSIQKLFARDGDLLVLCENKCFRVLANKDALFNADGNANITSNKNVLGQAVPFSGEFGISKNPESFCSHGFRSYFTDKNNGVVLRLSRDGLTEISAKGMQDFFSDSLRGATSLIGSYDKSSSSYNLTIVKPISNQSDTISYKENVGGWSSRKSFIQEAGISLDNMYFTFKAGKAYKHRAYQPNNFYGVQYESSVTFLFNEAATSVKGFKTLNYSGDKSRTYNDAKDTVVTKGWYADSIQTDLQKGFIPYFVKKENKWFNYIKGNELSLDTTSLAVQGLGFPATALTLAPGGARFNFSVLNSSLGRGDKLYYLVNGNPTEIGTVTNRPKMTYPTTGDPYGNVDIGTLLSALPTTSDFLFFAKDTGPNLTSLTGYYAEVTMKNDNTTDGPQELFSVATEIFQSSK